MKALERGEADILARYLSKGEAHTEVLVAMSRLLVSTPKQELSLVFQRTRGKPGNDDQSEETLGRMVATAMTRLASKKLDAALHDVSERTGKSKSTVRRAWVHYKKVEGTQMAKAAKEKAKESS